MAVEIDIIYAGDLKCQATHGPSGSELTTEAPVDNGGSGLSYSPTDLVACALGTCMATIMGLVAGRNKLDIKGTRIHVTKEMTQAPPRRIGRLTVTITLPPGKSFTAEHREKFSQAAELCPVKQSLHPDVKIQTQFIYAD